MLLTLMLYHCTHETDTSPGTPSVRAQRTVSRPGPWLCCLDAWVHVVRRRYSCCSKNVSRLHVHPDHYAKDLDVHATACRPHKLPVSGKLEPVHRFCCHPAGCLLQPPPPPHGLQCHLGFLRQGDGRAVAQRVQLISRWALPAQTRTDNCWSVVGRVTGFAPLQDEPPRLSS